MSVIDNKSFPIEQIKSIKELEMLDNLYILRERFNTILENLQTLIANDTVIDNAIQKTYSNLNEDLAKLSNNLEQDTNTKLNELIEKYNKEIEVIKQSIEENNNTSSDNLQNHVGNLDIHVSLSEKDKYLDKYTKAEIDNLFSSLESNTDWKESVNTHSDLNTTYPTPEDGWTVNVKDTNITYRYSGNEWIAISANAIPKATEELDGLLTKEDKTKINNMYETITTGLNNVDNTSDVAKPVSKLQQSALDLKLDKTGDTKNTTVTFSQSLNRVNINTGESTATLFGKIQKWLSDLKSVAFSGSYTDLSNKPTSLPANGGNADTIGGKQVSYFLPASASCNKNWNWSGQSGQPNWLWGGNDANNMYVYNPLNFNVNYANSAGKVGNLAEGNICRYDLNIDINNTQYPYPYMIDVTQNNSAPSTDWWHIIYVPHRNYGGGYGCQLAIPFYGSSDLYVRSANGTNWGAWAKANLTVDERNKIASIDNKLDVSNGIRYLNYKIEPLTIDDVNNSNFPYPYETQWFRGNDIGLPANTIHLKYFRHPDGNGAGCQLAFTLNEIPTIWIRTAWCNFPWMDWEKVLTTTYLYPKDITLGEGTLKVFKPSNLRYNHGNIAIGYYSLSHLESGSDNITIGYYTLGYLESGLNNIAIGREALRYNTSGAGNTTVNNSVGIGNNTRVSGDNQVQIGSSGQTVYGSSTYNVRSDARDKADIQDLTYNAYEFISKLKPRNFRWDKRDFYEKDDILSVEEYERLDKDTKKKCTKILLNEDEFNSLEEKELFKGILMLNKEVKEKFTKENSDSQNYIAYQHHYQYKSDGSKKGKRFHNGFIAQEVKQVMDEMGFDFAGFQDHSVNGGCDVYTLGYEQFIAPMVSTIQTMMKKIEVLEQKLNSK